MSDVALSKKSKNKLVSIASIASVSVAVVLLIAKSFALWMTDSMAILAGLVDSALDILASVVNFIALRFAVIPADDDHRFGHGKAEPLAGLAQATLISTSAILLIIENIHRFFTDTPVQNISVGVWVTFFTIILTSLLVAFQNYVVKKTDSLAIKADSLHYKSDIYLNVGILFALSMTLFTDYVHIDSVISLGIAGLILYSVKDILIQSLDQIMDKELPEEKREQIYRLAISHPIVNDIHDLRTRMSGAECFIQFHLELPAEMPLFKAHKISDEVEDIIAKEFPDAEIFVHLDPKGNPRENPLDYTVH